LQLNFTSCKHNTSIKQMQFFLLIV